MNKLLGDKVTSVEERVQNLLLGSQKTLTEFLRNGGWHLVQDWIEEAYDSKNGVLVCSILSLLKDLPRTTVWSMLEGNECETLSSLERIFQKEEIGRSGGEGVEALVNASMISQCRWLTVLKRLKMEMSFQEGVGQTRKELILDPDLVITKVLKDGRIMVLQPTKDRVWWQMKVEGRTFKLRMKDIFWKKLWEDTEKPREASEVGLQSFLVAANVEKETPTNVIFPYEVEGEGSVSGSSILITSASATPIPSESDQNETGTSSSSVPSVSIFKEDEIQQADHTSLKAQEVKKMEVMTFEEKVRKAKERIKRNLKEAKLRFSLGLNEIPVKKSCIQISDERNEHTAFLTSQMVDEETTSPNARESNEGISNKISESFNKNIMKHASPNSRMEREGKEMKISEAVIGKRVVAKILPMQNSTPEPQSLAVNPRRKLGPICSKRIHPVMTPEQSTSRRAIAKVMPQPPRRNEMVVPVVHPNHNSQPLTMITPLTSTLPVTVPLMSQCREELSLLQRQSSSRTPYASRARVASSSSVVERVPSMLRSLPVVPVVTKTTPVNMERSITASNTLSSVTPSSSNICGRSESDVSQSSSSISCARREVDDDVIALEDSEPLPWKLIKIHFTNKHLVLRRRASVGQKEVPIIGIGRFYLDTFSKAGGDVAYSSTESPAEPDLVFDCHPARHLNAPVTIICTKDVSGCTDIFDYSHMRWSDLKSDASMGHRVRYMECRRFIRKKRPSKPLAFVDLTLSPLRNEEKKRKREAAENSKYRIVRLPTVRPLAFSWTSTSRCTTSPSVTPRESDKVSDSPFSAVARDMTLVTSFLRSSASLPSPQSALQPVPVVSSAIFPPLPQEEPPKIMSPPPPPLGEPPKIMSPPPPPLGEPPKIMSPPPPPPGESSPPPPPEVSPPPPPPGVSPPPPPPGEQLKIMSPPPPPPGVSPPPPPPGEQLKIMSPPPPPPVVSPPPPPPGVSPPPPPPGVSPPPPPSGDAPKIMSPPPPPPEIISAIKAHTMTLPSTTSRQPLLPTPFKSSTTFQGSQSRSPRHFSCANSATTQQTPLYSNIPPPTSYPPPRLWFAAPQQPRNLRLPLWTHGDDLPSPQHNLNPAPAVMQRPSSHSPPWSLPQNPWLNPQEPNPFDLYIAPPQIPTPSFWKF